MNTKWCKIALTLIVAVIIAMPVRANDIPSTGDPTGMGVVSGVNFATIHIITGETIKWYEKDNTIPHAGHNNVEADGIFEFGNISIDLTGVNAITGDSTTSRNYSGFHTNANQGIFNLGATITIHATSTPPTAVNSNDAIRGFRQLGGSFSGTITGGTDIIVIATDSFFAAAATFASAGGACFENATITFGDLTAITLIGNGTITVPAEGSGATAFRAGDFKSGTSGGSGTHVTLGTLTAETEYYGEKRYAIGAHIGAINTGSSLTIKGIDVKSAGSAGGLLSADGDSNIFYALEGLVTIGSGGINVQGFGDSYGIQAASVENLNLEGNIKVTSTAGMSSGIRINGDFSGSIIGGKDITALSNTVAVGFGVTDTITGGTITLGDIIAAGKDFDTNTQNYDAATLAVGFTATGGITGGTININTITVRGETQAAGIGVGNLIASTGAEVTGGSVTVQEIDVSTTNGDAQGWYSGAVSGVNAALSLGTIHVEAEEGGAAGVYVAGNLFGRLSFTKITAIGGSNGDDATTAGIVVEGRLDVANGSSIGEIHAEASGTAIAEHVYGVVAKGVNSQFTTANDITAKVISEESAGRAIGIAMQGASGNIVTVGSAIHAYNEGSGGASGIVMSGNNDSVTVTGETITGETTGSAAHGIHMEGNNASVTINAGTVEGFSWKPGTITEAAYGVKMDGDNATLTLGAAGNIAANSRSTPFGVQMLGAGATINAHEESAISALAVGATTVAVGVDFRTVTTENKLGQIFAFTQGTGIGWRSGDVEEDGKISIAKIQVAASKEAGGYTTAGTGFWVDGETKDGSDIHIKEIEVEGQSADGARFTGNVAGDVTIDSITVISETGEGHGLYLEGTDNTNANIVLGTVSVTGSGTNAYGVYAAGNVGIIDEEHKVIRALTLKGNIDVKNTNTSGQAHGIYFKGENADAIIYITDDVTITAATSAMDIGGSLNLHVEDGTTLRTQHAIYSGGDMVICGDGSIAGAGTTPVRPDVHAGGTFSFGHHGSTPSASFNELYSGGDMSLHVGEDKTLMAADTQSGGGKIDIFGGGTANLGSIDTTGSSGSGDVTVRGVGTTLIFSTDDSELDGTNTVETGAFLKVSGNVEEYEKKGDLIRFAFGGTANNQFESLETGFVIFDLRNAGGNLYDIITIQNSNVQFSDGFLAAAMIHGRYTGYNMVRDHFISSRPGRAVNRRAAYRGQSPCDPCGPSPCDPCGSGSYDPCGKGAARSWSHHPSVKSAWVNYVGRSDEYRGWSRGNGWKISTDGVQAGSDLLRSRTSQLGVIFGYEDGSARNTYRVDGEIESRDRVNSDDVYVGAYFAQVLRGGGDFRMLYNHGWQDFNMVRSGHTSQFKGRTQEITFELGKRRHNGLLSHRPFIAADLFLTNLDAASESELGDDIPLAYRKLSMTQTFLRLGTDVRYQKDWFGFEGSVYYAHELNDPKFQTVISNGSHSAMMRGSNIGRQLIAFNLRGVCEVTDRVSLFGGYNGQAAVDRSGYQSVGYIGGIYHW